MLHTDPSKIPGFNDAVKTGAQALLKLAHDYMEAREYNRARICYLQIRELFKANTDMSSQVARAQAARQLGKMFSNPAFLPEPNLLHAIEYFKLAIKEGANEACTDLGDLYRRSSRFDEAEEQYEQAVKLSVKHAELHWAYMLHLNGRPRTRFDATVSGARDFGEWLGGIEAGNPGPTVCRIIAEARRDALKPIDAYLNFWLKAHEGGELGVADEIYRANRVLPADIPEFKEANSQREQLLELAEQYKKDIPKSLTCLCLAANAGNPKAIERLAGKYMKGEDVEKNPEFTKELISKLGSDGEPYFALMTGDQLISEDVKAAIEQYKLAGQGKIAEAFYKLGKIYLNENYSIDGHKIHDDIIAVDYLNKAYELRDQNALALIRELGLEAWSLIPRLKEEKMSAAEINKVGVSYAVEEKNIQYAISCYFLAIREGDDSDALENVANKHNKGITPL